MYTTVLLAAAPSVLAAAAGRKMLADSESWYKTDEPAKDCTWVAQFVPQRCDTKGFDKTYASEACLAACADDDTDVEDDENMTMADIDDAIMKYYKGGQYNECPVETMYWEHDETVYGGFKGCVGEQLYAPCDQDGFDEDSFEAGTKFYTFNETTLECTETDYTIDNRTFWIIWGLPTDTNTLVEKTGTNPVVKFPLLRATYPSYTWQGTEPADDSNAISTIKTWMTYLGAFSEDDIDNWGIVHTEGAEAGMVTIIAAKVLELASSTCNRHFCQLMQAPAYGYSPTTAAQWVNNNKRFFFTEGCPDEDDPEDVTITRMGWFPGTDLPTCVGWDNVTYSADSDSDDSPWYETMVYPENPSGVLKTPQIPDRNRRVCDACYLYPMFFGMNDFEVPEIPDCASWAFSVTKIYSASVRAGFVAYQMEPESNGEYIKEIASDWTSLVYGDYSEWSWWGQMQILDLMMEKPYTDSTSWIGAYSEIMNDKWTYVSEGFDGCPYIELTNPYGGAYGWFRMLDPYLGLHDGLSEPTFFADTMGVRATTYSFGFRGADPADYYGEGYTIYDFTRLQLFRDVYVYEEVGRRASIVCGGGSIPGYISGEEWAEMSESRRRRRLAAGENHRMTLEEHKELIASHVPRLTAKQVEHHALQTYKSYKNHDDIEAHCAPDYSTSCLFRYTGGTRGKDVHMPN